MPITRGMLTQQLVTKPLGCSTPDTISDNDHAKSGEKWRRFIGRTIGDTLIEVETDTAKLNLLRLFYLDETRPAIPPKLYNSAENPQIWLNVKLAICWVLSGPSLSHLGRYDLPLPGTLLGPLGRFDLPGIIDRLGLKFLNLLKAQAQFDQRFLSFSLMPLQDQLDKITASPDFFALTPEPLYQLLTRVFIPESTLDQGKMTKPLLRCPSTREEARSHLAKTYGDHYTNYDWSREVPGLLTDCLELRYDRQEFWNGEPETYVGRQEWY